jgi:spermidine/putrescine transport system substrate-binding protein
VNKRTEVERLVARLGRGGISRRDFVWRALGLGLSLGSVSLLLQACGGGKEGGAPAAGADSTTGQPAVADLGPIEKELHIYNWSDYIAEDTVPNFEKEFGVKVTYDTYESNEEMVAKLQAGATGYDIIVPSGYIVPVLTATDLIEPLNRKYIPNWSNVSPIFQNLPTDPGSAHTVPWQWGTTGIAYRTDRITTPLDSWAVFLDQKFHGKMTMMDDGREVIGAFLRYRGHSLNSTDAAELAAAKADAIEAKKHLKAYISAPVKGQLISGDVLVAQLWNGDTTQAKAEQPNLGYVIPKEGCTIWGDSMCVPKSAPNKRAAHEWMNYILRPEVGAALSDATGYGTPNAAAAKTMQNPVPYPTENELKRLEYQVDLGRDTAAWDQIWTEIKSA